MLFLQLLQRQHTTIINNNSPSSKKQHLQKLKNNFSTKTHTPNTKKPIIPLTTLPKTTKTNTTTIKHIPITKNNYQFKKHPKHIKSNKITKIPKILKNTLKSIFKNINKTYIL